MNNIYLVIVYIDVVDGIMRNVSQSRAPSHLGVRCTFSFGSRAILDGVLARVVLVIGVMSLLRVLARVVFHLICESRDGVLAHLTWNLELCLFP